MEKYLSFHLKINRVENGQYLAESKDVPGLVAQGRTIAEAMEIAQDVARKLIESWLEHGDTVPETLKPMQDSFETDITVAAVI